MFQTVTSSVDQIKGASLGLPLPECLTFGIHWLDLTLWPKANSELQENIRKIQYGVNVFLLGLDDREPASLWENHDWGVNCYRKHSESARGIKLFWDNCNDPTDLHLLVPGSALDEVFYEDIKKLYHYLLTEVGYVRCTRLDLAWDHPPFTMDQAVKESEDRGGLRAKAKDVFVLEKKRLRGKKKDPMEDGRTVVIGSRSSPRMVRIYDGRGFVRLELQMRQERADFAFHLLMLGISRHGQFQTPAEIGLGLLRDFMDFIAWGNDRNISRCRLLPWWESFVKAVAVIRHKIERAAMTVERSKNWIEKQVTPTLRALMECLSEEEFVSWLQGYVESAGYRLRAHHRRMILDAIASSGREAL